MDGCQWTNSAWGRDLDESFLAADFFAACRSRLSPFPVADPIPAWQEAILNKLPVLSEGAEDLAGHVFYVHRDDGVGQGRYGEITGMPDVAGQEMSGIFDAVTAVNVRAVQAHAGITADRLLAPTPGRSITGSAT